MSDVSSPIQIGSMDLFWMPRLQAALAEDFATELFSTWSLKRQPPNPVLPSRNLAWLHYALQIYKMVPRLQFNNYTYHGLCLFFDEWFTAQLRKEAKGMIVMSGFGLKAIRKSKKRGIPTIVECGSSHTDFQDQILAEEYRRNGLRHSLFPEIYRRRVKEEFAEADYIQIPSRFVYETFVDNGVPPEKLLIAHYGASLSTFRKRGKSDMSPVFRVICPSGVTIRKGARVLAEAWKKLDWKDAELHWVGDPAWEGAHLFDPMPETIHFHTWMKQEKLITLYRSCDVMALPTFEDGFAMVIAEAAACGLAPIITPNCCAAEFFSSAEDREGWLIPVNDVDALCEALIAAKKDRENTFQLGQRAALRARQFTWESYGTQVRANLKRVLG